MDRCTSMLLAALAVATIPGCGRAYECCSSARQGSAGDLGELGTCYSDGIDEYGTLWGHERCADDPAGRACISVRHPSIISAEIRCFDPLGPVYDVACCENVDERGRGTPATCQCRVDETCFWTQYPSTVTVEGDRCTVNPDAIATTDASFPDAGR